METTKTILEWLNEIEEPEIREAAIRQVLDEEKERDVSSLSRAIECGFIWDFTKEGWKFWRNYQVKLEQQGK